MAGAGVTQLLPLTVVPPATALCALPALTPSCTTPALTQSPPLLPACRYVQEVVGDRVWCVFSPTVRGCAFVSNALPDPLRKGADLAQQFKTGQALKVGCMFCLAVWEL